ncbi:hypothetical protein [Parvularcula marina]|nr:hypothetical protein [Parvularcula marina]
MAAMSARHGLETLLGAWRQISELACNPHTPLRELGERGWNAMQRGLAATDRARNTVEANIKALDKTIAEKTMPPISDAMAGELRSLVRQDPSRAFDLVREDVRFSSALLRAPAALSGLRPDQHDKVREMAELTHAPREVALRGEATAAREVLDKAGERAMGVVAAKLSEWQEATPDMGALDG